ncbi:S-layer homology domain-containing protein [Paenibacillus rigui]|uniref:SLH domain-containing protein n=1 Tax=Paenibacillus rigui TaxID=554312 RepID=A0A229UVY4_9BACL|nr:S-layer homology domain-containing protein [Paenibacillus rigui]OXM87602.1 hypothetical protein CF651_04580 [Paenibacillus rigui]
MHKVVSKLLLMTIVVLLVQPLFLERVQAGAGNPVVPASVWEQQAVGQVTNNLRGIIYSEEKGLYIAVGSEGAVLSSADAVHWVKGTPVTDKQLNGVTYGNGKFVAVGEQGTVLTSANGTDWTGKQLTNNEPMFQGIAFGANKFVAVGVDGDGFSSLFTSDDGVNWTDHSFDLLSDTPPEAALRGITFNGNHFTIEGFASEYISEDGIHWSATGTFSDAYHGYFLEDAQQVLSIGGDFAAGGQANLTNSYRSTTEPLYGLAYGQDRFVAVGGKGATVKFNLVKNGSNYEFEDPNVDMAYIQEPSDEKADLRAVVYVNAVGRFVTVGDQGYIGILKASDIQGLTWVPGEIGGTSMPSGLATGNWKYIVSPSVVPRPNQGDSAQNYTNALTSMTHVSVHSGQYIYVAQVDDQNRIIAWAEYAVNDANIKTTYNIKDVAVLPAVTNVVHGAAKTAGALGLPQQVEVTLDDNSKALAGVEWTLDSSVSYDPSGKQEQTFQVTGTLINLPANVTNTLNKQASVQVTVQAAALNSTARLAALTVSEGNLQPAFQKEVQSYEVQVAYDVTKVTVTASVYDADSTLSVSGATYAEKTGSSYVVTMPIAVGDNLFTLTVTAQDQHTQTSYQLLVHREDVEDEVKETLSTLRIGYAPGDSWESVTKSVTLANQVHNVAVTWQSSNPQFVTASGQVNRPASKDENIILTAVVNKAGFQGQRTFLLVVKKGSVQVAQEINRMAPVRVGEDGTAVDQTVVTRKTMSDGTKVDKVDIDAAQAQTALGQAAAHNKSIVRLVVEEVPNDAADQVAFGISSEAYSLFANIVDYAIETEEASIVLPKNTLEALKAEGNDLFFHFVPVRHPQDAQQWIQRAAADNLVKQEAGNRIVKQVGTPMTIETNYPANHETKLIFPLSKLNAPSNADAQAAYLSSLYIYIEHSDGEKEFKRGTVEKDASGKITGLSVIIQKFSTFTVLALDNPTSSGTGTKRHSSSTTGNGEAVQTPVVTPEEPKVNEVHLVKHTAYMNGFSDHKFHPEQSATRAELAAVLWRLISIDPSQEPISEKESYVDVTRTHWAYSAIEGLHAKGIMLGTDEGKFEPDRPLTRAEFAVLAVRWKQLKGGSIPAFADVQGHWAEAEIAALADSGFVHGYEDGLFHPNTNVSRAEVVTWLNRLMNRGPLTGTPAPTWDDVPVSHWAYGDIEEASRSHAAKLAPTVGEQWQSN